MELNELAFAGNAGGDAETKSFQGGSGQVTSFSLAHTEKGKDGRPDVTTWVRVSAFGGWADYAGKIKKGDNVFAKGVLNVRTYTDKAGAEKTSVELRAFQIGIIQKDFKPQSNYKAAAASIDQAVDIPF